MMSKAVTETDDDNINAMLSKTISDADGDDIDWITVISMIDNLLEDRTRQQQQLNLTTPPKAYPTARGEP